MNTSQQIEIESIEKSIKLWQRFILASAAFALLLYSYWFLVKLNKSLAESPENWGQFGDYIGGLLNPIMAYAAFFWLTKSVRLQKQELNETKMALQESADSQALQVDSSLMSARLTALSALSNSVMAEVQVHRQELQFIATQLGRGPYGTTGPGAVGFDGQWLNRHEAESRLSKVYALVKSKIEQNILYETEISEILKEINNTKRNQSSKFSA